MRRIIDFVADDTHFTQAWHISRRNDTIHAGMTHFTQESELPDSELQDSELPDSEIHDAEFRRFLLDVCDFG